MTEQQATIADPAPVAHSTVEVRRAFVGRTYAHLAGAVMGFVLLEVFYFWSGLAQLIAIALLSVNWLLVLGAFILLGWLARGLAARIRSRDLQYFSLVGYVVAESIIFVPLLYVAEYYAPGTIQSAALLTVLAFGGLTAIAFRTRTDFTFLRGLLRWIGFLALLAIVGAVTFGLGLGTWFSLGMIAFAGAAILYDTSYVLHHFPEEGEVAAALELFASVALLFWYVVSLLSSRE